MNINRTFSIPVATAVKLKAERNQSRTVTRAVNKYLDEKEEYSPSDLPTRQIMLVLRLREDCPQSIRVLIDDYFDNIVKKP
jgi:hypothetical protein